MMRIAFGPRTAAASWAWVGDDTASELGKYFDVSLFDDFARPPAADLAVIVKARPPQSFVRSVQAGGTRLVYLPIDRYGSGQEIEADAGFLRECDLVLLHSEALRPHIEPFCRRVGIVEHHGRYVLDEFPDFRRSGFVLWVGACQHVPHIVKWLEENPQSVELRLLTNFNQKSARVLAHFKAHEIGVRLRFAEDTINGQKAYAWSPSMQRRLMRQCRAAIDIKGADFRQATKPPTKAQQFVASGIPFGCNSGSSSASYFCARGFDVCDAADDDRLLSLEYWQETRAFARELRQWTSLDAVGKAYKREFESLTNVSSTVAT